jgi:hypothetical protein
MVTHDCPMSPRLQPLLTTSDFSEAELCALVLDGTLIRVGDCFSAVDEIPGAPLRAAALARSLPPHLIAERGTAAWVWGARTDPPRTHEVCVDIGQRGRPVGAVRLVVREVVIATAETVAFGSGADAFRVTTPLRTAIDLARWSTAFTQNDALAVALLMTTGGFSAADCLAAMDGRRNLPGKKRAAERLDRSESLAARLPSVDVAGAPDPLAVVPSASEREPRESARS